MSPNAADKKKNAYQVRLALENYYERQRKRAKKPKFRLNEYVRVAKSHNYPWKRGYDEQFSEEIYTIAKIKDNLYRPLYQLADGDGNKTDDMYYVSRLFHTYI